MTTVGATGRLLLPRQLRVEYPRAIYHVLSRGDRKQDIYLDAVDRHDLLTRAASSTCRAPKSNFPSVISLDLKYLAVKPGPVMPALVIGVEAGFPTGNQNLGLGEGAYQFAPFVALLKDFGPFCLQGNVAWSKQVPSFNSNIRTGRPPQRGYPPGFARILRHFMVRYGIS
ncbi:MAG TPA: hypothetical protein VNZ64_17440 [Candidatus Acidoferrum sp.]|nr:hypothetical protein [Candidatus Acidoferrum sp.]